jgi:hypothetical protein
MAVGLRKLSPTYRAASSRPGLRAVEHALTAARAASALAGLGSHRHPSLAPLPARTTAWTSAARAGSGGLRPASLTCTLTSFFAWARTDAWTAPEQGGPPQRCGNPPGGGCAFASAPTPAGAARCPAAAAPTHPPALPREGSESPSAVSGVCHFVRMHRPRRASSGKPSRQGRALRVAVGQPGHRASSRPRQLAQPSAPVTAAGVAAPPISPHQGQRPRQ